MAGEGKSELDTVGEESAKNTFQKKQRLKEHHDRQDCGKLQEKLNTTAWQAPNPSEPVRQVRNETIILGLFQMLQKQETHTSTDQCPKTLLRVKPNATLQDVKDVEQRQ